LPGTLAYQGLQRIVKIFKIEAEIRGRSVLGRLRIRQLRTRPVLDELKTTQANSPCGFRRKRHLMAGRLAVGGTVQPIK
jgi:hypothetical protein